MDDGRLRVQLRVRRSRMATFFIDLVLATAYCEAPANPKGPA